MVIMRYKLMKIKYNIIIIIMQYSNIIIIMKETENVKSKQNC